jgi:hypothetical protein
VNEKVTDFIMASEENVLLVDVQDVGVTREAGTSMAVAGRVWLVMQVLVTILPFATLTLLQFRGGAFDAMGWVI